MLLPFVDAISPAAPPSAPRSSLDAFVPEAIEYLEAFPDGIEMPLDVAIERDGRRVEVARADLPIDEPIVDIGALTMAHYERRLAEAATVFVNGPAGVYERENSADGTRRRWSAVAAGRATSVIGGGDTVGSAGRFIDPASVDFVSTGGGALIRYLSGQQLPLLAAMADRS